MALVVGCCKRFLFSVAHVCAHVWFGLVSWWFWILNCLALKVHVSRVSDDLLLLSATELARRIRNNEVGTTGIYSKQLLAYHLVFDDLGPQLSSAEVVDAFISRINSVNPTLNSVVEENFEEARSEARIVDRMIREGTAPPAVSAPFLGVPFTLKDCIFVRGKKCGAGIPSRKNFRADEDADVVRNMRNAGAIHLALTNVSEVCMWWESNNTVYGRSRNPYDTRRITGGSSGGEGSLIAAGGSVMGVGSDIGGSIRMPAFFNGIFGHKPTKYIVSDVGTYPPCSGYQTAMHCVGPICRYAEDLGPMLKVLGGTSGNQLKLEEPVDMHSLKIFYMEGIDTPAWTGLSCDMRDALKKVVKYVETRFDLVCVRVDLPMFRYSLPIWLNDMDASEAPPFSVEMTGRAGDINPFAELAKWFIRRTPHTMPAIGLAVFDRLFKNTSTMNKKKLTLMREHFLKQFQQMLGSNGVFLFPSHPTPAPFHNQPISQPFNFIYTAIFNSLGLPVTQCPLGLNKDGLPVGVQVVGALYSDHVTIAVAKELERAFGGWVNPGGFSG